MLLLTLSDTRTVGTFDDIFLLTHIGQPLDSLLMYFPITMSRLRGWITATVMISFLCRKLLNSRRHSGGAFLLICLLGSANLHWCLIEFMEEYCGGLSFSGWVFMLASLYVVFPLIDLENNLFASLYVVFPLIDLENNLLASLYVVFTLIDLENNFWFSRLVSLMNVFNFCIKKLALKAIMCFSCYQSGKL